MRRMASFRNVPRILIAVLIVVVPGVLAAEGQRGEGSAAGDGPIVITSTWAIQHPAEELRDDNILDPFLLEKFNIQMDWVAQIPHAEAREKLTVMFASEDHPDTLGNHNQLALYQSLGMDGYLVNVIPLLDRVPNYRDFYTDFQWDLTFQALRASNNELYHMPQFRPWSVTAGTVYRKDEFDRLGLQEPATVDELLANLRAIKDAHPDSVPWGNKWGVNQILLPLKMAYQSTEELHVNPFTEELVPYGGITDSMREVIKVMHTMYEEGLIDPEYATVTTTQFEDKIRQDRVYMVAASFVGWTNRFNILNQPTNPDAEWMMSTTVISATGSKAYYPATNGQPWGPAFTNKIDDQTLDRYLEYVDWLGTDEGIDFGNYGVEGETYNVVDGEKVYVDTLDWSDPDKIRPAAIGIIRWMQWSWDGILATYGNNNPVDWHEMITGDPSIKPFRTRYPFLFESDMARDEYSNLAAIIKDTYDQHLGKFITGGLDPYNDADWNAYLAEMERAGIEKFMEISVERYEQDYR